MFTSSATNQSREPEAHSPKFCTFTSALTASIPFELRRGENGYRVRVNHGEDEFLWPEVFSTLEKAGKEILQALTNASLSRGEI